MNEPLIAVKDLRVTFPAGRGRAVAVDGVDLALGRGEVLGLVGESGCGKTVLSLSLLGLVSQPGRVDSGEIVFEGRDLRALSPDEVRRVRGAAIAMIFQEPMTSLNPVLRVGEQLAEPLMLHLGMSKRQALARSRELLETVRLPDPDGVLSGYPHELSGGMRQRVMIAMALSCDPRLIIADEPTTALDVTIQKQILDLMTELSRAKGTSLLLITHNLGVVAQTCDRVAVMYSGRVVEQAPVADLFREPLHPYTRGLLDSLPKPGAGRVRLTPIPGTVPSPSRLPAGCHFHPRCPKVFAPCLATVPPLFEPAPGRLTRCWLHGRPS